MDICAGSARNIVAANGRNASECGIAAGMPVASGGQFWKHQPKGAAPQAKLRRAIKNKAPADDAGASSGDLT